GGLVLRPCDGLSLAGRFHRRCLEKWWFPENGSGGSNGSSSGRGLSRSGSGLEPAVCHINSNLFFQLTFRTNPEQIPDKHHFKENDRINGGPSLVLTIQRPHLVRDKRK